MSDWDLYARAFVGRDLLWALGAVVGLVLIASPAFVAPFRRWQWGCLVTLVGWGLIGVGGCNATWNSEWRRSRELSEIAFGKPWPLRTAFAEDFWTLNGEGDEHRVFDVPPRLRPAVLVHLRASGRLRCGLPVSVPWSRHPHGLDRDVLRSHVTHAPLTPSAFYAYCARRPDPRPGVFEDVLAFVYDPATGTLSFGGFWM